VPTLHLDATARPELLRYVWPDIRQTADIRLQTPHQRIIQTGDCAFALSRLTWKARAVTPNAGTGNAICGISMPSSVGQPAVAPGAFLVVAQERIEEALQAAGNLRETSSGATITASAAVMCGDRTGRTAAWPR